MGGLDRLSIFLFFLTTQWQAHEKHLAANHDRALSQTKTKRLLRFGMLVSDFNVIQIRVEIVELLPFLWQVSQAFRVAQDHYSGEHLQRHFEGGDRR